MIYTVTLSPSIDYIVRMSSMRSNTTNRTDSEEFYFGGKGINVSQVLAELDLDSTAFGSLAGSRVRRSKRVCAITASTPISSIWTRASLVSISRSKPAARPRSTVRAPISPTQPLNS